MNSEMPKVRNNIIAFTKNGAVVAQKLGEVLDNSLIYGMDSFVHEFEIHPLSGSLKKWVEDRFVKGGRLIFVGSVGIAVRSIAPFVRSKTTDPAVLVVDEKGGYVIPILSGHIGGANDFAKEVAEILDATAVITTATDLNNVFSVDSWAEKSGYHIVNPDQIKHISADLLSGKNVGVCSEFDILDPLPDGVVDSLTTESGFVIGDDPEPVYRNSLLLIPKRFVLGIGCRKNIDEAIFENVLLDFLDENKINIDAICKIVSVDIKSEEKAILDFSKKYDIRFMTFTPDQLDKVDGEFDSSDFVKKTVGVGNVCERASSLAGDRVIIKKQKLGGVTAALSVLNWGVKFDF